MLNFAKVEQLAAPVLAFYDVSFSYNGKPDSLLYKNLSIGVQVIVPICLCKRV